MLGEFDLRGAHQTEPEKRGLLVGVWWWGVGGCEGAVRAWIEVGTRRTQCLLQAHAPPLELSRDPGRAPDGVRQPELAAPRRDDRRDGDGANVPQDVLHKVVSVAYGAGRCERSRIAVAPTGRLADRRAGIHPLQHGCTSASMQHPTRHLMTRLWPICLARLEEIASMCDIFPSRPNFGL